MSKKKEDLEQILRRLVRKSPTLRAIKLGTGISNRILIRFRDAEGSLTLRNAMKLMDYFGLGVVEPIVRKTPAKKKRRGK